MAGVLPQCAGLDQQAGSARFLLVNTRHFFRTVAGGVALSAWESAFSLNPWWHVKSLPIRFTGPTTAQVMAALRETEFVTKQAQLYFADAPAITKFLQSADISGKTFRIKN